MNALHENFAAVCSQDNFTVPFSSSAFVNTPDTFGTTKLRTERISTGVESLTAIEYWYPSGGLFVCGHHSGSLTSRVVTYVGTTTKMSYGGSGIVFGEVGGIGLTIGNDTVQWNEY